LACPAYEKAMNTNYDHFLSHSHDILLNVKSDIAALPIENLIWKEKPSKWSAIEVLSHLNKMYEYYLPRIEAALENAITGDGTCPSYNSDVAQRLIERLRPQGKKRLFKTQTLSMFEPEAPMDDCKGECQEIIHTFMQNKERFHNLIRLTKSKNVRGLLISTPLVDKLKFSVPEVYEYILSHEDRHMVQIEEILELSGKFHN
jgi:hypothetical protein